MLDGDGVWVSLGRGFGDIALREAEWSQYLLVSDVFFSSSILICFTARFYWGDNTSKMGLR